VTVGSVGLHWNIEGDERNWWDSPECNVVQWHLYGKETYEVHALAAEMTRKVRETWSHGKPVLVGEFAYGGEAKPAYDHTHVGLWSAIFSGAGVLAHSAPPFNIDSDELMTPRRARHFRTLRDFLAGLPELVPGEISASGGASAWVLVGRSPRKDVAAVWLLAPGLADGHWRAEWTDDVTGRALGRSFGVSAKGHLSLTPPTFIQHVAARLSRTERRAD
jgi:hypothetical protein